MKGDLISINGEITTAGKAEFDPVAVLGANFIYQRIHTLAHVPLQCVAHTEIAEMSYKALYGTPTGISAGVLEKEIKDILTANRYSIASNQVILYLFPPAADAPPTRVLCCEKPLLYKGYAMQHTGLTAVVTPYEYPFAPHKTAISLAAHTYAENYARRMGADAAIAENYAGTLTGLGENPLFAVVRNTVLTTSIDDGAAESVERRLAITAGREASLEVVETPLKSEFINDYDELFTVTPQGIVSVRSCGDLVLPHSMAKNLAGWMKKMI